MNDDRRHDNETGVDSLQGVNGFAHRDAVPRATTPWQTLSARVISLISRKGGVGKTTSTVNLGAAFALSGHTVLIVGVDPQCGIARSLGHMPQDLNGSLQEIFTDQSELTHLAHRSPLKNLYFVSPGSGTLAAEELYLEMMDREVDTFVAQIDRARNLYDTILIDCPPALSVTTRAALLASDAFLVPVQAEELCCDSITPLLDSVVAFGASVAPEREPADDGDRVPELEGLFLTMVNRHTRMGRHATARIADEHGPRLLDTAIPRTVRLSEMALRGKPTVIYDRRSAGSRAYFDLADEIVNRYFQRQNISVPPRETATPPAVTKTADSLVHDVEIRTGDTDGVDSPRADAGDSDRDNEGPGPGDDRPTEFDRSDTHQQPDLANYGLDRLLAELKADALDTDSVAASRSETDAPDMVSLDDLLAEEENRAADKTDWDNETWEQGSDGHHLH